MTDRKTPKKVMTSADVDTETDVRFKANYTPKELEQQAVLDARIKRIVAVEQAKERQAQKEREALLARLRALPTTGRPN